MHAFISFHRKAFYWLNKTATAMPEFRSTIVFCENISVSSTFVSTPKTIIERSLKLAIVAKSREVKGNSYKLSKTSGKSVKYSCLPPHLHRESFWLSTRANIVWDWLYTERGCFWLEKVFLIVSDQHWLRSWHNEWEHPFNMTDITVTLSWALLVDALCWKFLV